MQPFYEDPWVIIYNADCREALSGLGSESVQCVVTSPPYWGLRVYSGLQEVIYGGASDCRHEWLGRRVGLLHENRDFQGRTAGFCALCGAWRGTYGLEPTPDLYVEHTIEVLQAIGRVLQKDGVIFWVVGDSFITGKGSCINPGGGSKSWPSWKREVYPVGRSAPNRMFTAIPGKNAALIPFRVAIAAQENGWFIRAPGGAIIWNKTNVRPESVKDRPTASHEYILMLTKSAKYYWDAGAMREASTERPSGNKSRKPNRQPDRSHFATGIPYHPDGHGRNIRSVWSLSTKPSCGVHFAIFPEELPMRCIRGTTRRGDTVLDPLAGTGTTGAAAKRLGRRAILIEISEEYCTLAKHRLNAIEAPTIPLVI